MTVGVRRRADNHLCALSRRGKPGRMAVLDQLLFILLQRIGNQPHGPENRFPRLVRRQGLQAALRRQLNIYAQPVRQQSQPRDQLRGSAGDGFCVDIAVEPVVIAQQVQAADHPLRGVVRTLQHAGGEKQPLNIIAPVELDGQVRQLLRCEYSPPGIVGTAVDTIFTVVDAAVGHQHFQQRHAPSVPGKGVAASGDGRGGVADGSLSVAPLCAAGCTSCIVFCRVRQDGQLIHDIHRQSLLVLKQSFCNII